MPFKSGKKGVVFLTLFNGISWLRLIKRRQKPCFISRTLTAFVMKNKSSDRQGSLSDRYFFRERGSSVLELYDVQAICQTFAYL